MFFQFTFIKQEQMKIIHRVVASLFSLLQTNLFFVFQMLLQVSAKRTNVPGLKQFRPRRVGFRSRSTHMPPYLCPYGYGYVFLILPTLIINQRRRFHRYFSWLTCKTQMVKTIMDYSTISGRFPGSGCPCGTTRTTEASVLVMKFD